MTQEVARTNMWKTLCPGLLALGYLSQNGVLCVGLATGMLAVSAVSCLMSDSPLCSGFGVEQAPYGMQAPSYLKDGLLDGMCPPSATPAALGSEQELQMLPKSRLNTVSVNYCSISQDFPGGNLNLLNSSSGKRMF